MTQADAHPVAIAIHGGAGTLTRESMTTDVEAAYHAALREALAAGHKVLTQGGSSVAAVQAAIVVMEDSPLFNAGRGAVFTHHGTNELDASVMEGQGLNAGAVAGVLHIKNPIRLAVEVMQQSDHVMLSGERAEEFAQLRGVELVPAEYFFTQRRWDALKAVQAAQPSVSVLSEDENRFGTVGAVALDMHGNLAAGTSTGGMTNKQFGRIGDSPIIGAGTYADNRACAISATGHGEYFIRLGVAHEICARVRLQGKSLQQAADEVIHEDLAKLGGDGGIIGLSPQGDVVFTFNSTGMYRGSIDTAGVVRTAIYR